MSVLCLSMPQLFLTFYLYFMLIKFIPHRNDLPIMPVSVSNLHTHSNKLHLMQHFINLTVLSLKWVSIILSFGLLSFWLFHLLELFKSLQHLFCWDQSQLSYLYEWVLATRKWLLFGLSECILQQWNWLLDLQLLPVSDLHAFSINLHHLCFTSAVVWLHMCAQLSLRDDHNQRLYLLVMHQ